jgi:hypothetical protein
VPQSVICTNPGRTQIASLPAQSAAVGSATYMGIEIVRRARRKGDASQMRLQCLSLCADALWRGPARHEEGKLLAHRQVGVAKLCQRGDFGHL